VDKEKTMELTTLLAEVVERGASDLHLVVGQPPVFRVEGQLLRREGDFVPDATGMEALLLPHLPEDERAALMERRHDVEVTLRWETAAFRVHLFRERGASPPRCAWFPTTCGQ
jgi:twitching motility protein PilT